MVSTRGIKFKFTEGERVLCYEPDPTKAKVLYESKVLDLVVTKDGKGRKIPEYLIHFNGWSSSWDRCVTEEFVLKDNEENRALQKRLAEVAAVHLKTRKKKRRLSDLFKESFGNKRRTKSSDDDSDEWKGGSGAESNASIASSCSSTAGRSDDEEDGKKMELEFPEVLRKRLEEVYRIIKQEGKLVALPCTPNVITILEDYIKNYTASALCAAQGKPKSNKSQSLSEKSINICKEVMDGIRIYFDFTLPIVLLYEEERAQYRQFVENYKPTTVFFKDEANLKPTASEPPPPILRQPCASERNVCGATPDTDISAPVTKTTSGEGADDHEGQTRRILRSTMTRAEVAWKHQGTSRNREQSMHPEMETATDNKTTKPSRPQGWRSAGRMTTESSSPQRRRWPVPPPLSIPCHVSSSSSSHSGPSTPTHHDQSVVSSGCGLLNESMNWQMVPQWVYQQVPPPPSLVYGAQHLLRLLVKLPEMLTRTNISDYKLKAIHGHLTLFIKYLADCREDLFSFSEVLNDHYDAGSSSPANNDAVCHR